MEKKDAEFVQPVKKPRIETGNGKKAKRIKSAKEFFGAPSAKCSIEGADMGVLERWLMELGIGWVLHLADGVAAGKLKLDPNHASSWIRALTEITNTFCLMVSLLPGHVSEEEEDAAAAAAMESEYISSLQDLSIIQQAMLKMLAFVDFIDKLHALLRVRHTLSKALSEIRLLFDDPSPSARVVERIRSEIGSVLLAKEGKAADAIRSQVEEVSARIMESLEDDQDSSGTHKVTPSVLSYIRFLRTNYRTLDAVVCEYVPQIGDLSPLDSMSLVESNCVLYLSKSYEVTLTRKLERYMESYIQVSWAPFQSEFLKTYNTQKLWKVPDPELRKTLPRAITEKIVSGYTEYIEDNKITTLKFTPRDLEEMLQELFQG
ncbi:hypothetical protein SETIT_1G165300v2 [Setaria italica]|uniref:Exocyst subunit Exo70 family protein n=1 Tax=Setaria italica TaxID=4555 RepID=A0A368PLI8_SETIT|nr:hypothetical protein SETIT_1G165300v2 [Setaria italica]